jgi:hypothetical protein
MRHAAASLALLLLVASVAHSATTPVAFVYLSGSNTLELIDASYNAIASIPLDGSGPASGAVLEPTGELVVRNSQGLTVWSSNGQFERRIGATSGRRFSDFGTIAALKSGWVASSFGSDLSAYAIDGSSRVPIDTLLHGPSFSIRALSRGILVANMGRELRIYSGWPLKLVRRIAFQDDITAFELEAPDTILIATTKEGNTYPPTRPFGRVTLFEYMIDSGRELRFRKLEEYGKVVSLRIVDNWIAAAFLGCYRGPAMIRFYNRELANENRGPLSVDGFPYLAVSANHLLIAARSCMSFNAALWDYDLKWNWKSKIIDGATHVYETDGS